MNKHTAMSFCLVLGLALASAASAQVIYRWVDADGVVHYGPRAPDGVEATLVNTSSPKGGLGVSAEEATPSEPGSADSTGEPGISYAEQRRRDRAERRAEAMQKDSERLAKCTEMERQRSILEPSPRVIYEDEEGNIVRMADEDRLARLEEATQYLSENCR